jgi:hypothetical protein
MAVSNVVKYYETHSFLVLLNFCLITAVEAIFPCHLLGLQKIQVISTTWSFQYQIKCRLIIMFYILDSVINTERESSNKCSEMDKGNANFCFKIQGLGGKISMIQSVSSVA